MEFNERVLKLIEQKRQLTDEINGQLQQIRSLGENQELFQMPLLPTVDDGNAKFEEKKIFI